MVSRYSNLFNLVHIFKYIIALTLFAVVGICLNACSDDTTSTYSTKNPVQCDFLVVQYAELFNVIDNYGQYATMRQSGAQLKMKGPVSENTYTLLETQKYFKFGLGGLIVGTTYSGEYRAYDLSCPNCYRVDKRLTIDDNGMAKCSNCKIVYNMNYDGALHEVPDNCIHSNPRGLLRYRIVYDGQYVHVYN